MKIKAEKKALLGAILPAMCALSTNAPIPVLESLKLTAENSTLYVTGYDLSKGVKTETAVFVEEEGGRSSLQNTIDKLGVVCKFEYQKPAQIQKRLKE